MSIAVPLLLVGLRKVSVRFWPALDLRRLPRAVEDSVVTSASSTLSISAARTRVQPELDANRKRKVKGASRVQVGCGAQVR